MRKSALLSKVPLPVIASAFALTLGGLAFGAAAPKAAREFVPLHRQASRSLYWGAYVAGGQYGYTDAPWDMRSFDALASELGKKPSLVEWGQDWYECSPRGCGLRPFRADLMQKVRSRGAIPVLSWGSYDERYGQNQPSYSLGQIIGGRYDSFIESWARGAKAWGHPFFLRFDWEMNTNSVPYSEHSNGNAPGQFAQMWRHVHDIFVRVGARNVTWVWCPNVEYRGSVQPLASLYPGAAYVDWTCLDGYNFGTNPIHPEGWRSFVRIFGPTYALLTKTIAPKKRLMIGETASTEVGGSKAAWVRNAFGFELTRSFARIGAVVWFNKAWEGGDWPLESSRAALNAFRSAIHSCLYASNVFAGLSRAPIPSARQAVRGSFSSRCRGGAASTRHRSAPTLRRPARIG